MTVVGRSQPGLGDSATAALLNRCTFPPVGTVVRCGVSGGADSTALMVLAVAAGLRVTAVHVDHGVRLGSAAEADVVAATASHVGAAFEAHTLVVPAGPNLEARMRSARHHVLGEDALLGHTADDQAETVLLHLMRGAGLDGLAAMRPDRRPMLALRRTDTVAVCERLGLRVIIDPSNADPTFRRNRVRAELLPLMDHIARRDVAELLAANATLMRDDVDLLDELSCSLDPTDCRMLQQAPRPLARRAVRRWLAAMSADGYMPDRNAIERVMAVVDGDVTACEVAGGMRVSRSMQRLAIAAPPAAG